MFITFEGLDFCGKSTQVELLRKYFIIQGKKVIVIREPGGTEISESIRGILLNKNNFKMKTETEFLLFSSSRAQLVREVIIPALNSNTIVISDRYIDSSIAYQGYGRGLDIEILKLINSFVINEAIPNLTFLIDIPVEESLKRKSMKQPYLLDRIEISENAFYHRVWEGYHKIAKFEKRFVIIDGTQKIEEIHKKIIESIISIERTIL